MTEDLDADTSAHLEFPKDNEVPVSGDRYEGNTQKIPDYVRTMDLDIKNIDEMIRIHGGSFTRQLMHLTLERLNYLSNHLLITVNIIQTSHKTFQTISKIRIKISLEESLYAQAVMISPEIMV